MIRFDLHIKSGTGGHCDYDGCDLILKSEIHTKCLPRIGETISYMSNGGYAREFLVTGIDHSILNSKNEIGSIVVYCVPIDGRSYDV